MQASSLGDEASTIEQARLLWQEGHHRKAIQSLEGALVADAFQPSSSGAETEALSRSITSQKKRQNPVAARANRLLAKWLDRAGQTQSGAIISQYRKAINLENRSEKGHYLLGRHYNRLVESESAKKPSKQSSTYLTGESAKLVIENYLRSLSYGSKYILQTLPRVLTLWLQLGVDVKRTIAQDLQHGGEEYMEDIRKTREHSFAASMKIVNKHIARLPAYVFYTVLSQIIARIAGCHPYIQTSLIAIVGKVCASHPYQAIWNLLSLVKSSDKERREAGERCIAKTVESAGAAQAREISKKINAGQELSEQLLVICNADVKDMRNRCSLKQLHFSHARSSPCNLAIPMESQLRVSLPTIPDKTKAQQAFPKDVVTISRFMDEVHILSSLVRPRKVRIVGSDGKRYSMLCKPKDDLRKDQRLLEFNSMISGLLKKDASCSKRGLYLRTYAVTPLNEECGLIEWVDGLRTMRDIILEFQRRKGIELQWNEAKAQLMSIKDPKQLPLFENLCRQYFPVLYEWFIEMFPEPNAWFNARLRWTRSTAVMSVVGHVLGLGDRHGENILIEEAAGGAFHVDFNCLFDKGATFDTPERVPFRLTQNVVDAMGAYGYEGPYRKAAELTLGILRQHEHTLMTALYPFVHDPTVDQKIVNPKKQKLPAWGDAHDVLEKVRNKVQGLLQGETLPLSVEGYVDLQIKAATDPFNLARMWIGWAPFL